MDNHICHISIGTVVATSPWNLSRSPSAPHALSCRPILPHWFLILTGHSNWIVSFTAYNPSSRSLSLHHSHTNLSCSVSHMLHHLELSSPEPSHLSSPTLYPTHHLSTTPCNTLLTQRHSHCHRADLTSHPTSCIRHCRSLTIQLLDSTSKQQTCKLQLPLHFLPLHNHRISTSRSPLPIKCTYASHQTLPQNPSHTPPNLRIHTTPITTPTLPTTPFPLPSQQT